MQYMKIYRSCIYILERGFLVIILGFLSLKSLETINKNYILHHTFCAIDLSQTEIRFLIVYTIMIDDGWEFCADIPMMMWRGQKINQDYVQSCERGTIDFCFSQELHKLLLNRQILQRKLKISWRKCRMCFDKHF